MTSKSVKFEPLSLFFFFFHISMGKDFFFIKMHNVEIRFVIEPPKYTFSRSVRTLFSPESLHAGAVKELNPW